MRGEAQRLCDVVSDTFKGVCEIPNSEEATASSQAPGRILFFGIATLPGENHEPIQAYECPDCGVVAGYFTTKNINGKGSPEGFYCGRCERQLGYARVEKKRI
ncbi:hypothetical protein JW826_02380 [Candidatus Woesearchaeota archaeon]|nr:hypothetical protein [Candidatus Woesearchaeota archaeon]